MSKKPWFLWCFCGLAYNIICIRMVESFTYGCMQEATFLSFIDVLYLGSTLGRFWVCFFAFLMFETNKKSDQRRNQFWGSFLDRFWWIWAPFSGAKSRPRRVSVWLGPPQAGLSLDWSGRFGQSWAQGRLRTPPRSIFC